MRGITLQIALVTIPDTVTLKLAFPTLKAPAVPQRHRGRGGRDRLSNAWAIRE